MQALNKNVTYNPEIRIWEVSEMEIEFSRGQVLFLLQNYPQ